MAGDSNESDSGKLLRPAFGDPVDDLRAESSLAGNAAASESVWIQATLTGFRAASQAQISEDWRTVAELFDAHRPVSIDDRNEQFDVSDEYDEKAAKASSILKRLGDDEFSVRRQASNDLASLIAEDPATNLPALGLLLKGCPDDPEVKVRIEAAISPYVSDFETVAADVPDACRRLHKVIFRPDNPWLTNCDPSRSKELKAVDDFVELFSSNENKRKLSGLRELADGLHLNRIATRLDDLDDLVELNRKSIDNFTGIILPTATDDDLSYLRAFPNLNSVNLQQSGITDAGLRHLSGLDKVTRLCLTSTNITGAGLKHLIGMKSLDSLSLDNTDITDAGLEQIVRFENLQFLDLGNTAISDRSLSSIGQLKGLVNLFLEHTKVTDAGLRHLEKLPVLGQLELAGTKVTQLGKDRLAKELPGLAIDFNERDSLWWIDLPPLY
jgi:hypothetical protein